MALDATISGTSSNSYVTTAEADLYFTDSLYSSSWTAVGDKDVALISATNYLEMFAYGGTKAVTEQALLHPRKDIYDRDGTEIVSTVIARDVKRATFELALYMSENLDAFKEADKTTRIKVAVIEIEQELKEFGSYSSLPLRVKQLIDPFLESNSFKGFDLERA